MQWHANIFKDYLLLFFRPLFNDNRPTNIQSWWSSGNLWNVNALTWKSFESTSLVPDTRSADPTRNTSMSNTVKSFEPVILLSGFGFRFGFGVVWDSVDSDRIIFIIFIIASLQRSNFPQMSDSGRFLSQLQKSFRRKNREKSNPQDQNSEAVRSSPKLPSKSVSKSSVNFFFLLF